MVDVREMKLSGLIGQPVPPRVGDMKKTADDIRVVDETMNAARKLAGTDALANEIERKEKRLNELEEQNKQKESQLHGMQLDMVKSEFANRFDALQEAIKRRESDESIKSRFADLKEAKEVFDTLSPKSAATELDMFDKMAGFMQKMGIDLAKGSVPNQVKEWKEVIDMLGAGEKKVATSFPADISLEITRLNSQVQLQIEAMKDERDRRDKEFQLKVMQWQDERESRRQEIDAKLRIEEERNAFLHDGIEKLGRVFASASAEGGGMFAQPPHEAPVASHRLQQQVGRRSPHQASNEPLGTIEAGVGEFGEIECQRCKSSVPIAGDAQVVMCAGCGGRYRVERIASEPEPSDAPAPETTPYDVPEFEVEEMDEAWQRGVR